MKAFLSPFASSHLFLSGVTTGQEGKYFSLCYSLMPSHRGSIHPLYFNPSRHICQIFHVSVSVYMHMCVCVCVRVRMCVCALWAVGGIIIPLSRAYGFMQSSHSKNFRHHIFKVLIRCVEHVQLFCSMHLIRVFCVFKSHGNFAAGSV